LTGKFSNLFYGTGKFSSGKPSENLKPDKKKKLFLFQIPFLKGHKQNLKPVVVEGIPLTSKKGGLFLSG